MLIFAHIRDNFAAAFFPRLLEWGCAGTLVALGIMLSVNADLMVTTASTGKGYRLLLAIADQATWASALEAFGGARLLVLLINGAWRRSPWARAGMAFISCFFWTQIVLSFSETFGFVFVFSCAFLAFDVTNVMRSMHDARTVDDAFRGTARGGR